MLAFASATALAFPVSFHLETNRPLRDVAMDLSSVSGVGVTYEERGTQAVARVVHTGEHADAEAALAAVFRDNPDATRGFEGVAGSGWLHVRPTGGSILDTPVTVRVPASCADDGDPSGPPPTCLADRVLVDLLSQVADAAGAPVDLAMIQGLRTVYPPEERAFVAAPAREVLEWWLSRTTPRATWSLTWSDALGRYGLDVYAR